MNFKSSLRCDELKFATLLSVRINISGKPKIRSTSACTVHAHTQHTQHSEIVICRNHAIQQSSVLPKLKKNHTTLVMPSRTAKKFFERANRVGMAHRMCHLSSAVNFIVFIKQVKLSHPPYGSHGTIGR